MKRIIEFLITALLLPLVFASCTSTLYTESVGPGSVSPDYSDGVTVSSGGTGHGVDQTYSLTAVPDEGAQFLKWVIESTTDQFEVDHESSSIVQGEATTGYEYFSESITIYLNPDDGETIRAIAYFEDTTSDLNISIEGEGDVQEDIVTASKSYDTGTRVQLTAIPESGWEFDHWKGDYSGKESVLTIDVKGNTNITAVFKPRTISATIKINGEGSYSKQDGVYLDELTVGQTYSFGQVPGENSVFNNWYIKTTYRNGDEPSETSTAETLELTVPLEAESIEIELNFIDNEITLPNGGVFNMEYFTEFIQAMLISIKGGPELFKVRNVYEDGKLTATTLDLEHIGDDGKNLFTVTHHYSELNHIESSSFNNETWTYTFNNLGRVSSVDIDNDYGKSSLDFNYSVIGEKTVLGAYFLGENVFANTYLNTEHGLRVEGLAVEFKEADLEVWKLYEFDSEGRVIKKTVQDELGSPTKIFSQNNHEYGSDGRLSQTTYNNGNIGSYSYYGTINESSTLYVEQIKNGNDELVGNKTYIIDNGYFYMSEISINLTDIFQLYEYRNKDGKIIARIHWDSSISASGEGIMTNNIKLDALGRIKECEIYYTTNGQLLNEKLGSVKILNNKATWRDASGNKIESSNVDSKWRALMQITNDNDTYEEATILDTYYDIYRY